MSMESMGIPRIKRPDLDGLWYQFLDKKLERPKKAFFIRPSLLALGDEGKLWAVNEKGEFCDEGSKGYLTIVEMPLSPCEKLNDLLGYSEFVSIQKYRRDVDDLKSQLDVALEKIEALVRLNVAVDLTSHNEWFKTFISQTLSDGIEKGVSKATEKQSETLQQIEAERQRLEEERAEIDRQLAKLQQAEERIQERERQKAEKKNEPQSAAGYVYLLKQINGEHYKIGLTNNPANRLKIFGVKLPFEVEFDHLIKTDDMYALEYQLHQRYAHCRVNGEWFALTPEEVDEVKAIKSPD